MDYIFFTGATGGLGALCVQALAERGYTVFAAGTNQARLERLGRLQNVIPVRADVTDEESLLAARRLVGDTTDRLYAVINFAGVAGGCSWLEGGSIAAAQRLLNINVLGMIRVNRLFFDLVLAGRGRIINCSSEAGWMKPQPFIGPYFMSKHAVEAYSDSLRREAMFLGVPVIKLQPGAYHTGLMDDVGNDMANLAADSRYFRQVFACVKPILDSQISNFGDPKDLVAALLRAVEDHQPRLRYRVGTGKLLALAELLPDSWLDALYRGYVRRRTRRLGENDTACPRD
ncbi:MAG: SDR family NAD(P)-dependent oxidoreductase [Clostridia bacterium]|nr:SDR family NAD(P)-dependent oxidoreductase [Clostridia bacterium]